VRRHLLLLLPPPDLRTAEAWLADTTAAHSHISAYAARVADAFAHRLHSWVCDWRTAVQD